MCRGYFDMRVLADRLPMTLGTNQSHQPSQLSARWKMACCTNREITCSTLVSFRQPACLPSWVYHQSAVRAFG